MTKYTCEICYKNITNEEWDNDVIMVQNWRVDKYEGMVHKKCGEERNKLLPSVGEWEKMVRPKALKCPMCGN